MSGSQLSRLAGSPVVGFLNSSHVVNIDGWRSAWREARIVGLSSWGLSQSKFLHVLLSRDPVAAQANCTLTALSLNRTGRE